MLNGHATVFLSCSEKFKLRVARPIRDALQQHELFGVIVSDEPLLPRTPGDPESKVESYIDASDAFVALCTPDNQLDDGTMVSRQNIIDEIQRAHARPHLRSRILVFKERSVRLPSNINPTYENLDLDDIHSMAERIVRQLDAWGVVVRTPRHDPATLPDSGVTVSKLIDGLELGDHEEATRRAYQLLRAQIREAQRTIVEQLRRFLFTANSAGGDVVHRASALLEAINRLDPTLVPLEIVEELAVSEDHAKRTSAAMILWDRAVVAPADVPVGLLGRLALPSIEDWYVQAPAMAATKQLLLKRREARIIFDGLTASPDSEDRYAVAQALVDVCRISRSAVPRDLAERLTTDADELVAAKGQEVLRVLGDGGDDERDPYSPFGL